MYNFESWSIGKKKGTKDLFRKMRGKERKEKKKNRGTCKANRRVATISRHGAIVCSLLISKRETS